MEAVFVSRVEVVKGLGTLKNSLASKTPPEVMVWCEKGFLVIQAGGIYVKLPSLGEWEGQAQFSAKGFRFLVVALPEDDPMPFIKYPESIGVGRTQIYCSWKEVPKNHITIPLNAKPIQLLGVLRKHSRNELESSGLLNKCLEAEQLVLGKLNTALRTLSPLGVTMTDLNELIDKLIDRYK
jgi:hypothetical protein